MTFTRRSAILVALALVIIAGIAGLISFMLATSAAESDDDKATALAIAACDRGNALRIGAFSNSILDGATRFSAASQYEGDVKEDILGFAEQNYNDAQRLVDASADHPDYNWANDDPELQEIKVLALEVLEDPGPPAVDCEDAFG